MFLITAFAQGSSTADRPLPNLRQLFVEFAAARADQRRRKAVAARVRQELSSYSERQLNDLGIGSGDIERIAREAAAAA